jgi:hypothetical protein
MPDSVDRLPLDRLPEPRIVREHLGRHVRETELLRRLLRLCERVANERLEQPEVRDAS